MVAEYMLWQSENAAMGGLPITDFQQFYMNKDIYLVWKRTFDNVCEAEWARQEAARLQSARFDLLAAKSDAIFDLIEARLMDYMASLASITVVTS